VLGLFHEHADSKVGVVLVRQQLREDGTVDEALKTERSRRDVKMFDPVRSALASIAPQNRLRSKFVFANSAGEPLNERTQGDHPWRRALTRAGIPHRPLYTLRHTYTSLMLSAGKPAQWVAHQLGHVGIKKVDEVYGRWLNTPDEDRLNLEGFFQLIKGLPPKAAKRRPIQPESSPNLGGESVEVAKSA
jgi:integrase